MRYLIPTLLCLLVAPAWAAKPRPMEDVIIDAEPIAVGEKANPHGGPSFFSQAEPTQAKSSRPTVPAPVEKYTIEEYPDHPVVIDGKKHVKGVFIGAVGVTWTEDGTVHMTTLDAFGKYTSVRISRPRASATKEVFGPDNQLYIVDRRGRLQGVDDSWKAVTLAKYDSWFSREGFLSRRNAAAFGIGALAVAIAYYDGHTLQWMFDQWPSSWMGPSLLWPASYYALTALRMLKRTFALKDGVNYFTREIATGVKTIRPHVDPITGEEGHVVVMENGDQPLLKELLDPKLNPKAPSYKYPNCGAFLMSN